MDNLDDLAYARCKACDASFYPQWRPARQAFEELCPACLKAAFVLDYYDEDEEYLNSLIQMEYKYD